MLSRHLLRKLNVQTCPIRNYRSSFEKRFNKNMDPGEHYELPVFRYARMDFKSHPRVYAWGYVGSGATGKPELLQPHKYNIPLRSPIPFLREPSIIRFFQEKRMQRDRVISVECGYGFTVFVMQSGRVYGTGTNACNQFGRHESRRDFPLQTIIMPINFTSNLFHANEKTLKIIAASCGRAHSLFLTEEGTALAIGDNSCGQCARPINTEEDYKFSTTVSKIVIEGRKITQVCCGRDHSLFVCDDGSVWACGLASVGQTGQNKLTVPCHHDVRRVTGAIENVKISKVTGRADTILAISDVNQLYGWGHNNFHQLGMPLSQSEILSSIPIQVPEEIERKVIDIAASQKACALLSAAGEVYTWGSFSCLGNGPKTAKCIIPKKIPPPIFGRNEMDPDVVVCLVRSGLNHMAAITNLGIVYTWGQNIGGCLGIGTDKDMFFPFRVSQAGSAVSVSCGSDHTAAITLNYK